LLGGGHPANLNIGKAQVSFQHRQKHWQHLLKPMDDKVPEE
jgi:hypothetical protein